MPSPNGNIQQATPFDGSSFWQLVRFGVTGFALTGFVSATYCLLITFTPLLPAISLTLGSLAASVIGYFVHGRFSFRGFGSRTAVVNRFMRFLMTNGAGYLLNLFYVLLVIDVLHWPRWLPIVGFCIITPMISFLLYRKWVFR